MKIITKKIVVSAIALLATLTTATAQTAVDNYLDIANYATIDAAGWNTSKIDHIYKNTVRVGDNGSKNLWVTMSAYGLVYGEGSSNWLEYSNETLTNASWSPYSFFLGSSAYFPNTTANAFGSNTSTERIISFYVTNVSTIRFGAYQYKQYSCNFEIYKCSKNANGSLSVATTPLSAIQSSKYSKVNVNEGFTYLDQNEIYKVICKIKWGFLYEIAFNFPLPESISVSIGDAQLSTFYCHFPVTIPDDENLLNVLYPREISGKTLTLCEISNNIPANTGVILFGNKGTYQFPVNTGTITPLSDNNLLTGFNTAVTCDKALEVAGKKNSDAFIMTLGQGKSLVGFYRYKGDDLAAHKAYMVYEPTSGNNVSYFTFSGFGGDDLTGIRDLQVVGDGAWYTLQGIKLNGQPRQSGLYIHNGKTVVVK